MKDNNPEKQPDLEAELLFDSVKDTHLLTPVVLIGASALIPVPFVDDAVKAYLEGRLFRVVAEREGFTLSKEERQCLTQAPSKGCCALGCLTSAFLYIPKRLLRKLFFFLEIKRAVDQSTTALAEVWLFRLTLRRELWVPGQEAARCEAVRLAIEAACRSQGVKPLEAAISHAFRGAKGTLAEFAGSFSEKTAADEENLGQAVDSLESEQGEKLAGITRRLTESLDQVSVTYLARFAQTFEQHLQEQLNLLEQEAAEKEKGTRGLGEGG